MSPLARPLLALAAAALLASASAEDDLRVRLLGLQDTPAACAENKMGATPKQHQHIRKNELSRFHVDPPQNSTKKFEVYVRSTNKKDEALVGQVFVVCDIRNPDNKVEVKPHRPNQHSPLTVTCAKGCPGGVELIADQFVIKQLS